MKHKIEVIAEGGINHCGEATILKAMIEKAAECGADTFKTQLYDPTKVFGPYEKRDERFSELEWQAIFDARLTRRQLFWIKAECERAKINFLSSVSDLERLGWLEDVGVDRYKIASDDAMNEELCLEVLTKGKPVIISDGHIVGYEPLYLRYNVGQWLYCISEYPTRLSNIEFPSFSIIGDEGRRYKGFSDHTVGISATVMAISLGARIIEKHFTIDKVLPGPDQVCSADPDELRQLCRFRDDIEKILYKD